MGYVFFGSTGTKFFKNLILEMPHKFSHFLLSVKSRSFFQIIWKQLQLLNFNVKIIIFFI